MSINAQTQNSDVQSEITTNRLTVELVQSDIQLDQASARIKATMSQNVLGVSLQGSIHTHSEFYKKTEIDENFYDKEDVDLLLESKAESDHDHDDLYYGEAEIDALLNDLSPLIHNHDDRYFTESEITTLLNAKANTSHSHTTSDITSGTFDDGRISESSVTQHEQALTITESQISDLSHYSDDDTDTRIEAQKGLADGLATLDGSGKVPTSQLPAIAVVDVNTVGNELEQLALTADEGDVAVRTDLNRSYIHNGGSAGTMSDWSELLTPRHDELTIGANTADALSLDGQELSLLDKFVRLEGDSMTGDLTIDTGSVLITEEVRGLNSSGLRFENATGAGFTLDSNGDITLDSPGRFGAQIGSSDFVFNTTLNDVRIRSTGDIYYLSDSLNAGNSGDFIWKTNSNTIASGTELMRLTDDALLIASSVAIGASSSDTLLLVSGSNSSNLNPLRVVNTHTGNNATTGIQARLHDNTGTERGAGNIFYGKEGTWTSTNSTINSYQAFYTVTSAGGTEKMRLTSSGNLFIGDTSNAFMTRGLTINQGSADDEILAFKSSDLNLPYTSVTEADTFYTIGKNNATAGGLLMRGFGSGSIGYVIQGYAGTDTTTKSTSGVGNITFLGRLSTGTTGGDHGANANIFAIRNNNTTVFLVDAEGDVHYDATTNANAWDDYDDMELLTAIRTLSTPDTSLFKRRFSYLIDEYGEMLEKTGVITLNEDGHHFVSTKGLNGLIIDAMRQMNERIKSLEDKFLKLGYGY